MSPLSEILFLAIALYLLYRFVFNFILPVYKVTRQVKQQFRNMQHPRGGPFPGDFQDTQARPQEDKASSKPRSSQDKGGEYIDFEEIK